MKRNTRASSGACVERLVYGGTEQASESSPRLVRIIARKFATPHLDEEDLVQEGMLAYIKAEKTFDPALEIKFETYASRVITNRFIDILRKQPDIDTALDESKITGSFNLDDTVNLIEIKKILTDRIGDLDRAIFNAYIQGFSYEEISKIFTLPRKKIDNTVQKVKRTIKSHI